MINRWYLLGAAVLFAGCVDLSGANFSNIGNGNSASNFGNGNSASNIGNGNSADIGNGNNVGGTGGDSGGNTGGGTYTGPNVDGVRLNHEHFILRRIDNFNPNDYRYDSIQNRFESNNYMASPLPSTPIINPDECVARGYALSGGNQIFEINKDQADWEWILPNGVQLISLNTFNGPPAQMLWANQTAATGSYPLRLEYRPNRSISVSGTVEIRDQGSVQVEL